VLRYVVLCGHVEQVFVLSLSTEAILTICWLLPVVFVPRSSVRVCFFDFVVVVVVVVDASRNESKPAGRW
jgi:cell division protein FtsW (lipid II flippase)